MSIKKYISATILCAFIFINMVNVEAMGLTAIGGADMTQIYTQQMATDMANQSIGSNEALSQFQQSDATVQVNQQIAYPNLITQTQQNQQPVNQQIQQNNNQAVQTNQQQNQQIQSTQQSNSDLAILYNTYGNLELDMIFDFLKYNSFIYSYSQKHLIDFCKANNDIITSAEVIKTIKTDFENIENISNDKINYPLKDEIKACFNSYIASLEAEEINFKTLTFDEYLKVNSNNYAMTDYYLNLYKSNVLLPALDTFVWGVNAQTDINQYKTTKDEKYIQPYIDFINNVDMSTQPLSIKQLYEVFLEYYDTLKAGKYFIKFNPLFEADVYELYAMNLIYEECNKITEYDDFKLYNGSFYFLSSANVFQNSDDSVFLNYATGLTKNTLKYDENIHLKLTFHDLLLNKISQSYTEQEFEQCINDFEIYRKQLESYYNNIEVALGQKWSSKETIEKSINLVNGRYSIVYNSTEPLYTYVSSETNDANDYSIEMPVEEKSLSIILVIIPVVIIVAVVFILIRKKKEREQQINNYYYNDGNYYY